MCGNHSYTKDGRKLYSIGETARIMGVSVQKLRNYSNAGMLTPGYIDEDSGYRYYSFEQFHYIDRIRYLRELDMPLSDIQEILHQGTVDTMEELLEKQRRRIEAEKKRISMLYEDILWYQDYFAYLRQYDFENVPYLVQMDKRYILTVDYAAGDTVESVETRLAALKNSEGFAGLHYRRQFGYVADYEALCDGRFQPEKYYVYLKDPDFSHPSIQVLPAGMYLCVRSRICAGEWNSDNLARYLEKYQKPVWVLANEYEDNLVEYHHCPYEVQILLQEKS